MNYPAYIKKEYNKYKSFANRGMNLEYLINQANEYYLDTQGNPMNRIDSIDDLTALVNVLVPIWVFFIVTVFSIFCLGTYFLYVIPFKKLPTIWDRSII